MAIFTAVNLKIINMTELDALLRLMVRCIWGDLATGVLMVGSIVGDKIYRQI